MKRPLLLIVFTFLMYWPSTYGQWTIQNSGTTTPLRGIDFLNSDIGIITGYDGNLLRTSDGGTTWDVLPILTSEILWSAEFVNESAAWVCGTQGTLLFSKDHGETWAQQVVNTSKYLKSIEFINDSVGWVVGF